MQCVGFWFQISKQTWTSWILDILSLNLFIHYGAYFGIALLQQHVGHCYCVQNLRNNLNIIYIINKSISIKYIRSFFNLHYVCSQRVFIYFMSKIHGYRIQVCVCETNTLSPPHPSLLTTHMIALPMAS